MASTHKQQLVDELVTAFRTSGNQDNAFDNLAADRLGINRTHLLCLNAIENSGGLTPRQTPAPPALIVRHKPGRPPAGNSPPPPALAPGRHPGVFHPPERPGAARRVPDP